VGLVESLAEYYPESKWQRCMEHFYRNVFNAVPRKRVKDVAAMLKAIHVSEDKAATRQKAEQIIEKLEDLRLREAAKKVRESIDETLTYYDFPRSHHSWIRTNNVLERIMKEIRRRTKVVGAFPDGHSALMLCAARLRHIAGTKWGQKRYLNMELLKEQDFEQMMETDAS
jgi:transposase-like protein